MHIQPIVHVHEQNGSIETAGPQLQSTGNAKGKGKAARFAHSPDIADF